MQQVMEGVERDNMMTILSLICAVQHNSLIISGTKDLTFAVVTSVDVDGIHDRVTSHDKCGRPLHSIPLSPCSVEDIDDMVDRMVDFEVQNNNLEPTAASDARRELLWAAHATGGHFRSLEKLWLAFRGNPSHFTVARVVVPAPRTSANILDVIAHRLHDPLWLREETIRIGAAFSKQGLSMTLYDTAVSDVEGVFYEKIDAKYASVVPRVMPSGLSERSPFEGDTDVAQGVLWGEMRKLLTSVGRADATNGWELGLPLLEVIASTLIHEVNGKKPVAFGDVWRGAFVQHWAGREAELFYRPLGSDCASVIRSAMTTGDSSSDKRMEASNDEVLRAVCWSGVPTLRRAENSSDWSFKGLHTLLEEPAPRSTRRPVPVVFQMRVQSDVHLERWAVAAHADAKARLGVTDGTYFVVLYDVSNTLKLDGWKSRIPEGTIVRR
ncbi:Hypothetical protein, putative [Bodo saltans]|uniref:Uncharacterized protein n=1 Tax=Bodo saltans TaxID=75058 RepID=A0A0S4JBJ5_BODSA|nr:Hypothetical protein, putative [Bodo saltans]|eukprot:CUG87744.1 Hypothetical protein, putative [Bodo saltans]